jgi:hypothetical protein
LSFAVLWWLSFRVPIWLLLVLSFAPFIVFGIWVVLRMQEFYRRVEGVLVSQSQLETALHFIDINMKGAYIMMMISYAAMAMALLRGSGWMLMFTLLATVPFGIWSTNIEKKYKAMTSPDPMINQSFASAVAKMKEPRFGLKL